MHLMRLAIGGAAQIIAMREVITINTATLIHC